MQRYVVLAHDWPSPHYDLMLEADGVLKTWRVPQWPLVDVQQGEALPDHRLVYLEFEGQLTGNRGSVRRVGSGSYQTLVREQHRWQVSLAGDMTGKLTIQTAESSVQLFWQADGSDALHSI